MTQPTEGRGESMPEAYVGIDVAIQKEKLVPIVVCKRESGALIPLLLKGRGLAKPPRGRGNAAIIERDERSRLASETVAYLRWAEKQFDVQIARIGIDAPSAPRPNSLARREAEVALDKEGISCIGTPSESDFEGMPRCIREHLAAGKSQSTLPCANQLWMLFGFELFKVLSAEGWDCLEVYPQATVQVLNPRAPHKTSKGAVADQLRAASKHTGWPQEPTVDALRAIGFGNSHDRLDAYLAAWVASLAEPDRRPFGHKPNDVIWVPKVNGPGS